MALSLIDYYQNFQKNAVERIARPYSTDQDSLIYWRSQILFTIIMTGWILGTIAIIASIGLFIRERAWEIALVDVFCFVLCMFLIFSNQIRHEIRISIALLIFYAIGIVVILTVGPLSGGAAWLFSFAVLVAVLLGVKPALLAVFLNAISLSVIAWLISTGAVGHDFPVFKTPQSMIAAGVNFLVLNAITALSVAALVKGLISMHEKEKALAQKFEQERIDLIQAKRDLEIEVKERQTAEASLQKSEERFRSIFESTTDFIFLKDHNMRYIMVNPAMIQLFGRPVEDLIGRTDRELFGAEAAKHIEEIDTRVLAGETVEEEDKKPVNDRQLTFHVKKTPVWGADGSVAALCGIARDITDHKQIEEKLHQAQKMRAIGTLAGGIAHEFNNMLGIIMGNTELAIDDLPDSHPVKRYLEETMTASLRARDVVRKLLSVARKSMITQKTIQINNVVQETLNLLRRTIPTTIDIRSNLFCTTEKILADPTEISQLVMNLCINSAHSMSGEPGILEVRLEAITLDERSAARYEHSQPGDYARLTVIDTGAGIPPDIMDRIFDPYFTTKNVDEGLGLGLAIVHGIVKSHNGMINIESETGKGTTVEVMIPLVDSQPESTENETDMLAVGSERILLIDDEASLVEMAKQMITRSGYEVVAKTDSMDALRLFSSDPFRFD